MPVAHLRQLLFQCAQHLIQPGKFRRWIKRRKYIDGPGRGPW